MFWFVLEERIAPAFFQRFESLTGRCRALLTMAAALSLDVAIAQHPRSQTRNKARLASTGYAAVPRRSTGSSDMASATTRR
jgi:hypothetical protein